MRFLILEIASTISNVNDYIGQNKRKLSVRVGEHQQESRNTDICNHIKNCKTYKSKFKHFKKPNNDPNLSEKQPLLQRQKLSLFTEKLKYLYFTTHLKISQKDFRSYQHRFLY